jgi:hypothetical protein
MTKDREFETLARVLFRTSQATLKEFGYLSPTLIVAKGNRAIIYSLPRNKEIWFSFVMSILQRLRAESYFVANEAWSVAANQLVHNLPLSANPARTEMLIVHGIERFGGRIVLEQQFVHDPDETKFVKPLSVCNSVDVLTIRCGLWQKEPLAHEFVPSLRNEGPQVWRG